MQFVHSIAEKTADSISTKNPVQMHYRRKRDVSAYRSRQALWCFSTIFYPRTGERFMEYSSNKNMSPAIGEVPVEPTEPETLEQALACLTGERWHINSSGTLGLLNVISL
jgi:hypothetical protein